MQKEIQQKCLVILEVSQKQLFIFSSNKLKENVTNSGIIAWVTSSEYFKSVVTDETIYQEEKNLVYAGGGHTILVFDSQDEAKKFVSIITLDVLKKYEGLELFATVLPSKGEITNDDLKMLAEKLEKKKAKRLSSFHQRSFGVEIVPESEMWECPEAEIEIDKALAPTGFNQMKRNDRLGGTKGESNFVAIVHIDGNGMGNRVEELRQSMAGKPWDEYRKALQNFSMSVDQDFKDAYHEMVDEVANQIMSGKLEQLSLQDYDFPIRRVITAGDDICFIAEGRIGIECAVLFLKKLAKKRNKQDGKKYAACAGVAIVHHKYPFYRAYDLAESLCKNAKNYIATNRKKGNQKFAGANVCAIDWHIEYGEVNDSVEETRKMLYRTADNHCMEMRPYIVLDPNNCMEDPVRNYENVKKQILKLKRMDMGYAQGKLKELRNHLKEGEVQSEYYMKRNRIGDLLLDLDEKEVSDKDIERIRDQKQYDRSVFIETGDGKKHSLIFDAIEIMDTYLAIDEVTE